MSVVGGIMTQAALLRPIAAVPRVQKRVRFVLPITDEPRRKVARPKPPRSPIRRCFGPRIFI